MGKIKVGNREIVADRHRQYMTTSEEPTSFEGVDLTALKPKMKRFARHYMSTVNVTQSAEAAGYNASSGFRLLKREDIQAYLHWLVTEQADANIASPTEVLEGITSIAKGDTYDEVVLQSGQVVKKRVDSKDRLSAYVTLAKFHNLLQPETQVNNQFNIQVDIVDGLDSPDENEDYNDSEEIMDAEFTEVDETEDEVDPDLDTEFITGIGK